jgi:hypothetical protein
MSLQSALVRPPTSTGVIAFELEAVGRLRVAAVAAAVHGQAEPPLSSLPRARLAKAKA